MADRAIVDRAVAAAPKDYVVAASVTLALKAVGATMNGASAGGPFLPAVQLVAPDGTVMFTAVPPEAIAAGGSAVVSWFPGGGVEEAGSSGGGSGTISSLSSPLGTLSVSNPTGPNTNVDMPATGVTAGSYGDASHSSVITVDAEGRLTSASQVGIAGGTTTIGFEIGYDQITAPVNVASTNEAAPTTIIAGSSYTFDGAAVLATFFAPYIQDPSIGANPQVVLSLWEGATQVGRLVNLSFGNTTAQEAIAVVGMYRFTPSAAAHTYSIKAHASSATGPPQVGAGGGGVGAFLPAFLRFTKV